jgi:hypothetical protein
VIHPALQYPAEPLMSETSRTAIPIPQSIAVELSAQVARFRSDWILTNEIGRQLAVDA